MSRSKRAPYWTQGYGGKARQWFKRKANRSVRNLKIDVDSGHEIADGKAYRKVLNPYDICDWKFHDRRNPKARRK